MLRYNAHMANKKAIHESFCSTYADAVVRFVVTGVNEDVCFDAAAQAFVAKEVDDGVDPIMCDFWVGKDWQSFTGPLACATDLADPKFSEEELKDAIVHALKKSATGKRMSQILADID